MSLSAEQATAAAQALADIEQTRQNVLWQIGTSWDFALADSSTRDANRAYLTDTAPAAEGALNDELGRVDSGEISWDRWVGDAYTLRNTIASLGTDYDANWSFSAVLHNAASATVTQVAQDAKQVAAALPTGVAFGAAAFVLLLGLYIVWKVS